MNSGSALRLLIVEDNHSLVANLFEYFEARGYILDAAPDGLTGLHLAITNDYDAIVLDWMLPRMAGPEVASKLRLEARKQTPIIMLTARDELADKLGGFRAGADDYLTKPFDLPELEVRIEALRNRCAGERSISRELVVEDLRLDLGTLEVERAGKLLKLYPACRRLLETLMRASPAVVPRERLEAALWGDDPPDADLLRSHMYELRRAIDSPFEAKLLHTVPKEGYRLGKANAE
ncbi:response regulator transcription factor [Pseudomarimonas salicorniae]|uniref:Response regulator transcription factor n=1 Tax=Pseudomarimonas salicorniae TaxID=2933270 RepID=A0ABT0GDT4_9GAMM|nr:response regulator transcription factor [Lysobacter sp. CAU 1642]MCK7592702.1 response regulator transcription factor [Lysobacter sp. CAU 1642]